MKNKHLLLCMSAMALSFAACTKDGDTIINNYGTDNSGTQVKHKALKEFGLADTTQVIKFSYQNEEFGKLKEMTIYASGVAGSKLIFMYNASSQVEAYQMYSLPANTLAAQGTMKRNAKNQVIEVVQRAVNGDTNGIAYFDYSGLQADFQPSSYRHYDKSSDRIDISEYFTYDSKGNVIRVDSYENTGSGNYKSSQTDIGTGSAINSLPGIYYYIAANASFSLQGNAAQYFSNYFPVSTRTQSYNSSGDPSGVSLQSYTAEADADNNITRLSSGSQDIYFKY